MMTRTRLTTLTVALVIAAMSAVGCGQPEIKQLSARVQKLQGDVRILQAQRDDAQKKLSIAEDRKKVPEIQDMWVDIGAGSKAEALKRVAIGDVAVYDQSFEWLAGSVGAARAFDDKAGAYTVCETLLRLARLKSLAARVVTAVTTQEEIGTRGAITAAYSVAPQIAIAVDVGHATDHPNCDNRKYGEFKLGGGPIICRGANINPIVFEKIYI